VRAAERPLNRGVGRSKGDPVQLEGSRITLREFLPDDIAELERHHADPRYLEFYAPEVSEPTFARTLVELFIRTAKVEPRYDYTLAIVERLSSPLIGSCSLRTAGQKPGYAEFGMGVAPDFWGRGLAAEAAREMLRFGFEALRLDEIRGVSVTANRRVGPLVTKLGFVKIGEHAGAPWMTARGWTHTVWLLTKATWVQ
jgi:ribosomal-protein-alanine N-acetyltransferase